MKNFLKNFLFGLLIFLGIAGIFALFTSPLEKPEEISLSELVSKINNEEVKEIAVENNRLEIILKDDIRKLSEKEAETSFTQSLSNYGVEAAKLAKVNIEIKEASGLLFWISNILPFLFPFLIIAAFFWFMMKQAKRGQTEALSFSKARARLFSPKDAKNKITFKDVAGLKEAKEELEEVVEFLKSPKKFINLGAKIPKGVLLIGPPGTGKTMLARAVANEAGVPFFSISGSEFVELFVGVGAGRVRSLFQNAKKNLPAIIFVDELDAVGRQRGTGLGGGHDEREQTLNQILVEMDGFDPNIGLVIMAASNRPDVLDPALLRPGRFDRRVTLDLPDIEDRKAILIIHTRNKPLDETVTLREIAERTPGFSGADLANLVNEAAILAARRGRKTISQEELRESIEKVLLGPERKSRILSKEEKLISAYHEAAHALVAHYLPHTDPVHKISIVARGIAAGYTLKLPEKDKHLYTKSEFIDDLAVFLAGYAAEKVVFNELTTGASNDLEKATELARRLVTEYGMSEKIGPVSYSGNEEFIFIGRELGRERHYSEGTIEAIDKEVSQFIKNAYKTAKKIIGKKRIKLNKLAGRLVKKETIERKEFEKIMKEK